MSEFVYLASFAAGELSPEFFGRTDLEKRELGVAQALNFTVDFRGGLKSRPGFEWIEFISGPAVLVPYKTSRDQSDIMCIFLPGKMYFMQDGAFLLSAAKTVTSVTGAQLTCAAHGLTTGDLVRAELAGLPEQVYRVTAVDPNTVTLELVNGVLALPSGGGSLYPLFSLSNPYTDLTRLRWRQRREIIRFVHPEHKRYKLVPQPSVPFAFSQITPSTAVSPVTSITATPTASGSARAAFAVTTVDIEGNETCSPLPILVTGFVNYTVTAGSMSLSWPAVPGAVRYRIYRSIITENPAMSVAQALGFIGETTAPQFIDNNIISDFSIAPPQYNDPFADGAVLAVEVTASGSGYTSPPAVSISGGTGFLGYTVLNGSGGVAAVIIRHPGEGYVASSTVSFSGGGGSGAAASITSVSPLSGNNPQSITTYQQRVLYGGTKNLPLAIFGSHLSDLDDFSTSPTPTATDSYILELDSDDLVPIQHLIPQRSGVLVMHENGVDKLSADEGRALTALSAQSELEVALAVGPVSPALIGNDVIFTNPNGTGMTALAYTYYSNSYAPTDLSVLSSHLLGRPHKITQCEWVEEPDRLLWCVREDGLLLSLTYFREQQVYAWARHETCGRVLSACVLREDRSRLYALIERKLNGVLCYSIERLSIRKPKPVQRYIGTDMALLLEKSLPTGGVQLDLERDSNGTLFLTGAFNANVIPGRCVDAWGGRFELLEEITSTKFRVREVWAPDQVHGCAAYQLPTTNWRLLDAQTTLSALSIYEGMEISLMIDGACYPPVIIDGGELVLPRPGFSVVVGLPFKAYAETLPLSNYERRTDGRRKRPVNAVIRLHESRGLSLGTKGRNLYEMKDRTFEPYGEVTALRSDNEKIFVEGGWRQDAQLAFLLTYPLPVTILGLAVEMEIED